MPSGHFVDVGGWKRRAHFDLYRALPQPFWSVTADADVTRIWDACARGRRSFFLATSFAALEAVLQTEALLLRLRPGGAVWRHDRVGLSTTVLRDDETFGFAVLRPAASFVEFEGPAHAEMDRVRRARTLETPERDEDDLVFHSSLPWLRFRAFTNARGGPDDCIPRLVFGRVFEDGQSRRMPVAVEVHHALVDGLDVARFFERFDAALARPMW